MRIEAVLSLHPAWAQIENLDRIRVQFATMPPLSGRIAPDLPPLPAAFAAQKDLPNSSPEQRLQRADASSDQYLNQLAETLRLQDEAYVERLARRQMQAVQAVYAKELASREAEIRAERLRQASELDRQITRLKFRDIAFQTQLIYKGQARLDAQLQHEALLAQIKALTQQADALLSPADITNIALVELKPRLQELRQQADLEREQERAKRAARRAEQLQKEKGKLAFDPDPLPPLNTTPLPAPDLRETPLILSPGVQASVTFQAANAAINVRRGQQEAAWKAQRERLLEVITADTEKAVAQIARQQGWNLVSQGTRGAQDETEAVKPLLRRQWMQGRME